MFVLAFEFLFDVFDDFHRVIPIIAVQPADPFLDSAVHPDLAAVIDEPVNKTVRFNEYLVYPEH
jgi:hypothetical protein